MIDNLFSNQLYIKIVEAITFDVGPMWDLISSFYTSTMLPIGYVMLLLYFLLELIDKSMENNYTIEHFVRLLIKLIVGKMLMDNALVILDGVIEFGNLLATDMASKIPDIDISGFDLAALRKDAEDAGFIAGIGHWLKLAIPNIAAQATLITAMVTCWGRSIEIVVRMLMAPIGMADVFTEGTKGAGFRYLKKFLAVSLHGVIILACAVAMNIVQATIMVGSVSETVTTINAIPTTYVFSSVALGFTTVTLIQKSREWSNDVCGV